MGKNDRNNAKSAVISLVADHSPRFGQIRQRMSEIQWEIEYGADWIIETCASRDDDFDHSYHTDVGV
jgi:hypothetical protein